MPSWFGWKAKQKSDAAPSSLLWNVPWVRATYTPITVDSAVREGLRKNSAVYACVHYLERTFPEPAFVIEDKASKEIIVDHPLAALLANPNPFISGGELKQFTIVYQALGGNCYWWIERDNLGTPIGLWPLHDGQCEPVPGERAWLTGYQYKLGSKTYDIPASDIVHFKWGVDPLQPIRGLSPLVAMAREVATDSEMTDYAYAVLKNDATPRTVLSSKGVLSQDARNTLKEQFAQEYGGGNRGKVAVIESDVTISRLSMNMQELAFESMSNIDETRIAACFGVPAVLVGLNVGLQRGIQGAPKEMQRAYVEQTLVPLWVNAATTIDTQLLQTCYPDAKEKGLHVRAATEDVQALQEDADAKHARIMREWTLNVAKHSEARAKLGYTEVPKGEPDYYFTEMVNLGKAGALTGGGLTSIPASLPAGTGQKGQALDSPTYKAALTRLALGADADRRDIEQRAASALEETLQAQQRAILDALRKKVG